MNLKEAFRWQRALDKLMSDATYRMCGSDVEILSAEEIHKYSERNPNKEDVTKPVQQTKKLYKVDDIISLEIMLIKEREKLSAAISEAKRNLDYDIDVALQTNKFRNYATSNISIMLHRNKPRVELKSGSDYMLDINGAPVSYVYPVEVVYEDAFDRAATKKIYDDIIADMEAESVKIETAMINAVVNYTPVFNIRASIDDLIG